MLNLAHSHAVNLDGTSQIMGIDGVRRDRAVMAAFNPLPIVLSLDDREGVLAQYGAWQLLPGLAVDVAVNGSDPRPGFSTTWATSANNTVWKLVDGAFVQPPGLVGAAGSEPAASLACARLGPRRSVRPRPRRPHRSPPPPHFIPLQPREEKACEITPGYPV